MEMEAKSIGAFIFNHMHTHLTLFSILVTQDRMASVVRRGGEMLRGSHAEQQAVHH